MAHHSVLSDELIFKQVEGMLNSPVADIIFVERHLSEVFGLRLEDGRQVVAKVRPAEERLRGCSEVQRHLWQAGYPAPEPLSEPILIGTWMLSVEAYVAGGEMRRPGDISGKEFACALARFIELAPSPGEVGPLGMLPWLSSSSGGDRLWPVPDDVAGDLNTVGGPDWIDEAARFARERLEACVGPAVIGHGDWSSHNLHWIDDELHVVHDWDSVVAEHELTIVGVTAAFYPANGHPEMTASLEQTEDFIDAYSAARDRTWSSDETEILWAAGLWNRTFDAKKQVVEGRIRTLTEQEARQRMLKAGA